MRHWVGVVDAEQLVVERLYAREQVCVPLGPGEGVEKGDTVVLAGGDPAVVFGHGTVRALDDAGVHVEYRGRLLDEPSPLPADVLPAPATPGMHPLPAAQFTRLSALVDASAAASVERSVWFVSLALPIEASTAAEAVREFWSYVERMGPQELPAYVWPLGDELAMRAFVLGAVTNLDPEEDEE